VDFLKEVSKGYHKLIEFRKTLHEAAKVPDHLVAPEDVNNPDNLYGDQPISVELLREIF
jgi:hypothetical protein